MQSKLSKSKHIVIDVPNVMCKPESDRDSESCELLVLDIIRDYLVKKGLLSVNGKVSFVNEIDLECEDEYCSWHFFAEIKDRGRTLPVEVLVSMDCSNLGDYTLFNKKTVCNVFEIHLFT